MSEKIKRVPWTEQEDEAISLDYAMANGGFNTYQSQADKLNRQFHSGKPVRTAASVRGREAKILTGGVTR